MKHPTIQIPKEQIYILITQRPSRAGLLFVSFIIAIGYGKARTEAIMTIHLISSPPFGEYFWTPVQKRLVQHGYDVCIHTPVETHSTLEQIREQLSLVITPQDDVVAHGLGAGPALKLSSGAHGIAVRSLTLVSPYRSVAQWRAGTSFPPVSKPSEPPKRPKSKMERRERAREIGDASLAI